MTTTRNFGTTCAGFSVLALVIASRCDRGGHDAVDAGIPDSAIRDSATQDDCLHPYAADPRDSMMTGEPVKLVTSAMQYDLQVPKEIKDWLDEHNWVQEHGNWHSTRRCGFGSNEADIKARGLSCAAIQEGQPGDGYAFLAMHHNMIEGLKQAFPRHFSSIRAFSHVPLSTGDSENPFPWKSISWNPGQLRAIALLEQIEAHVDAFASDDELGNWIQFAAASMMSAPDAGTSVRDGGAVTQGGATLPPGGIHADLHAQFAVSNSPYSLLDNNVDTNLLAFWRLHGWIDNAWGRYRAAKGLRDDDATYQAQLLAQCEEMPSLDSHVSTETADGGTAATGVFATKVLPIFETYCTGCHSPGTRDSGLTLVGQPAVAIRGGLVGAPSSETALMLIQAGNPDRSWLMRKLTGDFTGITCTTCKTTMPPAGNKPSAAERETIRAWIAAGATDQ